MKKIVILTAVLALGITTTAVASNWEKITEIKIEYQGEILQIYKVVDSDNTCYTSVTFGNGVMSNSISCVKNTTPQIVPESQHVPSSTKVFKSNK